MSVVPRRRWQEMSSADFTALDPERTVAILPIGAIEQHGPHLPVYVDACINAELLDRTLAQAPPDMPITALPLQAVGKSNEHLAFPGTLTLSADTLTRVCMELGESVNRAPRSANWCCSIRTAVSRRSWTSSRASYA